jgi:hypothetical protein
MTCGDLLFSGTAVLLAVPDQLNSKRMDGRMDIGSYQTEKITEIWHRCPEHPQRHLLAFLSS